MSAGRSVHCQDAITWLQQWVPLDECSLVASLPDISEFPSLSLEEWQSWFMEAAALIMSRTPASSVSIFYQTDIKLQGVWVDKAYLCQRAAEAQGCKLLWHKIACRVPAGQATFGRPAYSHIICFSRDLRLGTQHSTPDVIPKLGEKTWERGMGLEACTLIANFIKQQVGSRTVVNPFCGQGSMLAAANAAQLAAIGIERSAKRAELARNLQLIRDSEGDAGRWVNAAVTAIHAKNE